MDPNFVLSLNTTISSRDGGGVGEDFFYTFYTDENSFASENPDSASNIQLSTASGHSNTLNLHNNWSKSLSEFVTLAVVAIISSLFNIVSIYLISQKKRLRVVDYLVGNLSFSTFFMCLVMMGMYSLNVLNMHTKLLCGVSNYLKYFPGVVMTLSSFGISFERIRSLKVQRGRTREKQTSAAIIIRTILPVWFAAAIIASPSAIRSTYNPDSVNSLSKSDLCKRVPLFNSKFADVLYELLNFFFLHLLFSSFLLYELYLIRSKIKYLCVSSIPGLNLRKKVFRVRFAFFYTIILISIWISSGIVHLNYKIPIWFASPSTRLELKSSSKSLNFLKLTVLFYLFVNPIVVFLSNEGLQILRNLFCCCPAKPVITKPKKARTSAEGSAGDKSKGQVVADDTTTCFDTTDADVSRFATQNATVSNSQEDGVTSSVVTVQMNDMAACGIQNTCETVFINEKNDSNVVLTQIFSSSETQEEISKL